MTKDLAGGEELSFTAQYIRVPGSIGGGIEHIIIKTLLEGNDKSFYEVD